MVLLLVDTSSFSLFMTFQFTILDASVFDYILPNLLQTTSTLTPSASRLGNWPHVLQSAATAVC